MEDDYRGSERMEDSGEEERRLDEFYRHQRERKQYLLKRYDWLIGEDGYKTAGKYPVRNLIQAMSDYSEFSGEIENCFRALKSLRNSSQ
ncbi:MAG: hypothetical protein J7K54_05315 [Candidatus Aenigmarchaeota archaeon]|nr:hypothetical protein [Candidatus Aenigmarchaeota archaeon]